MNTVTCVWIALVAIYVTEAEDQSKRENHVKCMTWSKKFEKCLRQGHESTKFSYCKTGTSKPTTRQPYCTRWESYLHSARCDYDCPKSSTASECHSARLDCQEDRDCVTKLAVYQEECGLMQVRNMSSCTESCFKAYHHLRMDKNGGVMVGRQCDDLGVKNVKYSCIKQPPSRLCVRSVERCSDHCKALAADVSKKCLVGFEDGECTEECRAAYLAIRAEEGAAELLRDCHGISTVLNIKCFA